MPETPLPAVLPPQIDATFKDSIFNLIATTIDAKMPDIVQGAENLFKTELLRWIDTQKKLFDNGLADGFKKLDAEMKLKIAAIGTTAEEKITYVLKNLDDLAKAFGAPQKLVDSLKGLENLEKPIDFINSILTKLSEASKNPSKKEVAGIFIAIVSILSTLSYVLGGIFGVPMP